MARLALDRWKEILATLALAATAGTQAPGRDALGLANRWYAPGGSVSRSGTVMTEPLEERPEPAWQWTADGVLVGEPLVWDDVVVVECEQPNGVRRLQVLSLVDGQPIVHRVFRGKDAAEPLAPALWHDELVLRVGDKLKRYRYGPKGCSEQRVSKIKGRLGPPLRVGSEVYLLVNGAVERWDARRLERVWRSGPSGFVGNIAIAGNAVYAVRGDDRSAQLAMLSRAEGSRIRAVEFPIPMRGASPEVVVGGDRVFVWQLPEIPLSDGSRADALAYTLPLAGAAQQPALAAMPAVPAAGDGFWIASCGSSKQPMLGIGRGHDARFAVLATDAAHAYLVGAPITVTGQLAYVGGVAVDTETFEVRWRIDAPAGARAIPARDMLLFATADGITTFRRPGAADAAVSRQRERSWQDAVTEGERGLLQAIVEDALAGLELDLVDELLERCRALGVDEEWVEKQAKARKSKRRLRPKPDPERLPALQQRTAAVAGAALAGLWQRLSAEELRPAARLQALRFVLERDPKHAGAIAAVAELVPAELRPEKEFVAVEWLGFLESTRAIPIDFLPVLTPDQIVERTQDSFERGDLLELLKLRDRWRKDLVAVTSPRLCVYTPVSAHGSLSRCLSLGELVCDTLEAMFEGFPAKRSSARRMRILLFENQEEYRARSPGGGHLAWTAGHYSAADQLSRMFLPKEKEAFLRVMPVFAHELVHQWLQDRCPALSLEEAMNRRGDLPGHWVVEGFASFVEEFVFDLEARTYRTDNQRDENLDILAHAAREQLLPWDLVLRATPLDFHEIDPRPRHRVMLGYRLGVERQLSQKNFYYAQAGALCHWLWHADDGARRRALLEFVLAYYRGDVEELDLRKKLGMTADAIGAAVRSYAEARKPQGG